MGTPLERTIRAERVEAIAGQPTGRGDDITAANDSPRTAQVATITTPVNPTASPGASHTYSLKIDGVLIEFTDDGSPTRAEIAEGLRDAVKANGAANAVAIATATATELVLTARVAGVGFEVSEVDSSLTLTATTANAEAASIPFGRLVALDDMTSSTLKAKSVASSNLTAKSVVVEYVTGTPTVRFMLEGADAPLEATAGGASAADLATAIDALDGLDAAAVGSDVTVTASVPGQGFDVLDIGAGAVLGATTAGDSINDVALGVTLYDRTQELDLGSDEAKYAPNSAMGVRRSGRVVVDVESDLAASTQPTDVYVRLEANGALDKIGGFSTAAGAGLVKLTRARWVRQIGAGLAELDLRI